MHLIITYYITFAAAFMEGGGGLPVKLQHGIRKCVCVYIKSPILLRSDRVAASGQLNLFLCSTLIESSYKWLKIKVIAELVVNSSNVKTA